MSTIFIQIASYRDEQLIPTLKDCLATASDPDSLRFGICWQRDSNESLYEFANDSSFRIIDVPYRESRGACWARSQAQKLYRDETYVLQIDSHHRFAPGWDSEIIDMLESTGRPKPILSTYVPHFDPETGIRKELIPTQLVFNRFHSNGVVSFDSIPLEGYESLEAPVSARFCAAGFLFTRGRFCREVPYDPQGYFSGEEISLSVRAFTHGYDLFHPHKAVLWHAYGGNRPRHWEDHVPDSGLQPWWELAEESYRRIRVLFGIEKGQDLGLYGLGDQRSLTDYQEYAGIHFRLQAVHPATREYKTPPTEPILTNEKDWQAYRIKDFSLRIPVEACLINPSTDLESWRVSILDSDDGEMFNQEIPSDIVYDILAHEQTEFLIKYRAFERGTGWSVCAKSTQGDVLQEINGEC